MMWRRENRVLHLIFFNKQLNAIDCLELTKSKGFRVSHITAMPEVCVPPGFDGRSWLLFLSRGKYEWFRSQIA